MKYYAGIGSRDTPNNILNIMTRTATYLSNIGYTLRSGGAKGADSAFEAGAKTKEIFIAKDSTQDALELTANYHPAWHKCNDFVKKLHARNAMILLGRNLNLPVHFVICWTPNAEFVGGTGQALRIAKDKNIQIINLSIEEHLNKILAKIN
jgi:hypothetical protein